MVIQESAENYLESILVLRGEIGNVRSIDIANRLRFSKPSVSVAMKQLAENGYISVDENGYISLLDAGEKIASEIYARHTLIADILISLGVNKDTAYEDSCRIEHDISNETFDCLKKYYKGGK